MSSIDTVLKAWISGNKKAMKSCDRLFPSDKWKTLHTNGDDLYSYGLCIGITTYTKDGYAQKQVLDHRVNGRQTVSTQRHIRRALEVAPVHPDYQDKGGK